MHIDFALPVDHDLLAGWAEWQRKAEGSAVMDYGFHMAVTSWSARVAADMASLARKGVNSFKFFMAYKGGYCVYCVHCVCARSGRRGDVFAAAGSLHDWPCSDDQP